MHMYTINSAVQILVEAAGSFCANAFLKST